MAGATNTFETGLTPGTVITGANSGNGDAGTGFGSNWYMASGATPTYADDHVMRGDLSGKLTLVSSAGGSLGFNTESSPGHWTRGYFRFSALPSGHATVHTVRDGAVAASGFWVRLQTSGVLQILDRTTFTGVATSPVLSPGVWYRLETHFRVNGAWEYWLYEDDSETALATSSGTIASTSGTKFDFCRWGAEGSGLSMDLWMDDLAWSDVGKIGASYVEPPPVTPGIPHLFYDTGSAWVDLNNPTA